MNKVFIFAMGVAVGSVATWKIVEAKYKRIADEEIESVKEAFKNRNKKEINEGPTLLERDTQKGEYEESISKFEYSNVGSEDKTDDDYTIKLEESEDHVAPYIITPDECGAPGYDMMNWTCYADLVVTDDDDDIVTDYENIVGDALSHVGEYADNFVYVRNEDTKCDYEILKVNETYTETHGVNS